MFGCTNCKSKAVTFSIEGKYAVYTCRSCKHVEKFALDGVDDER